LDGGLKEEDSVGVMGGSIVMLVVRVNARRVQTSAAESKQAHEIEDPLARRVAGHRSDLTELVRRVEVILGIDKARRRVEEGWLLPASRSDDASTGR
jgi:hypothetical protein